jgi:hypothetical protein
LSPQTRRGRTAPASHRKTSPNAAPAAAAKPAAAAEGAEDQPVGNKIGETKPAPIRHGRRAKDLSRIHKSPAYRYMHDLFGAYTPLLIAFVILFAGVWGWVSFGPHAPTPQDNWSKIETKWMTPREDARTAVSNSMIDFNAQIKAYKDYRNATNSWMNDLSAIKDWSDPKKTTDENATVATDMGNFIAAGQAEIQTLDEITAATDSSGVTQYADQIASQESTFDSTFGLVRSDIMGTAVFVATPGPLAVPTPTLPPCSSPDPSVSPDPSATPEVCATPGPSISPAASQSAGPSLSPAPSLSAKPS